MSLIAKKRRGLLLLLAGLAAAVALVVGGCGGDNGANTGGAGGNNTVETVGIGEQTWTQNLNIKTAGSWCYENKENNCRIYGRLYTWPAAMKVCPTGFHLPTDEEWKQLTTYAGALSGRHLKSRDLWAFYSGVVVWDSYGFSALPGGYRRSDGSFDGVGTNGDWWTATEYGSNSANYRSMYYGHEYVFGGTDVKEYGHSVRCVGD